MACKEINLVGIRFIKSKTRCTSQRAIPFKVCDDNIDPENSNPILSDIKRQTKDKFRHIYNKRVLEICQKVFENVKPRRQDRKNVT